MLAKLLAGDAAGYREHTARLLADVDPAQLSIEILRCCNLSPEAAVKPSRLVQMAEELKKPVSRLVPVLA